MRVVLDTNVLMSGIFFGGEPGKILNAWRAGEIVLVASAEIVEEYIATAEALSARYESVPLSPVSVIQFAARGRSKGESTGQLLRVLRANGNRLGVFAFAAGSRSNSVSIGLLERALRAKKVRFGFRAAQEQ
jgi:hypothetical protein